MILYVLRFKSFHPCASVPKIRRRQKSCETALKRKSGKGKALRNKKLRVIEEPPLAEAGGERDLPLSSRTEYLSRAKVYLALPSVNVDVNTSKSLHEFVLEMNFVAASDSTGEDHYYADKSSLCSTLNFE